VVVPNATQTITTPNAAFISYNLTAGATSAAITPVANKCVLVMACCTTSGDLNGVGQASLVHIPGTPMEWSGLESAANGVQPALTWGASSAAQARIIYIDWNHLVYIQVASADTIDMHNGESATRAGNVTLI
jgi:hypothetical protein